MKLLEVRELKTYFHTREGIAKAVDGVSFEVEAGESFGLVGESGCGKTTAALSILHLLPKEGKIASGEIFVNGEDIVKKTEEDIRKSRWKDVSIIFQGAMNSLNPVMRISKQISEAIMLHEKIDNSTARKRAEALFEQVGLDATRINQYPHEFSGGMRQRVMIALALACNPKLVIADEPTTALDVMVQAQILDLLDSLKERWKVGIVLISHDLSVILDCCQRLGVMYAGKIMEIGSSKSIFTHPFHPYTKKLIHAFPDIKAERTLARSIAGDLPNPFEVISGCKFHPRCDWAEERCKTQEPIPEMMNTDHQVFCWKWNQIE